MTTYCCIEPKYNELRTASQGPSIKTELRTILKILNFKPVSIRNGLNPGSNLEKPNFEPLQTKVRIPIPNFEPTRTQRIGQSFFFGSMIRSRSFCQNGSAIRSFHPPEKRIYNPILFDLILIVYAYGNFPRQK